MDRPWEGPDGDEGPDENGCTSVPDFNFRRCCSMHDRAYSRAGGLWDRWIADLMLARCIWCFGHWLLAPVYFLGVRCFGWWFWNWSVEQRHTFAQMLWFVAGLGVGVGGHIAWDLIRH